MRATARHHLVGIPGKQGFFKAMLDRLLNLWIEILKASARNESLP